MNTDPQPWIEGQVIGINGLTFGAVRTLLAGVPVLLAGRVG